MLNAADIPGGPVLDTGIGFSKVVFYCERFSIGGYCGN